LLPDLVPQAATLRRGEGLQLQAALAVHDGDPGRLVLHDAYLHLKALSGRDQQAAEVDPLLVGEVFLHVPRTAHPGRLRAGLTGAGLRVTRAVLAGPGLRPPLARLQPVGPAPGLAGVGATAAEHCPPPPSLSVPRWSVSWQGARSSPRCLRGGLPGSVPAGGPEAAIATCRPRQ